MSDTTILAVDPDQTVLSFIRRIVTRKGHAFCGARRGEDALAKARDVWPDAIIARTDLTDMTGPELVARLREDSGGARSGAGTPILLTAVRGQEESVAAALELGAVSVIYFPFNEVDLADRLDGLIPWAKRTSPGGLPDLGDVPVDLGGRNPSKNIIIST